MFRSVGRLPLSLIVVLFVATLLLLPQLAGARVGARSMTLPVVAVATPSPESHAVHLPHIHGRPRPNILIAAAHIDSTLSGEPDEALLLWNNGSLPQAVAGWQIDTKSRTASFPVTSTVQIAPQNGLWCTGDREAFQHTFGTTAGCTWDDAAPEESNGAHAPVKLNGMLQMRNAGGWIQLKEGDGYLLDTLVYGDETAAVAGWQGAAAQLYTRGVNKAAGQLWQRKHFAQLSSGTLAETNSAADWGGDLGDLAWGRRIYLPGWRTRTAQEQKWPPAPEAATVSLAVAPEGAFALVADVLRAAQVSIDLNIYTFEHPALAQILAEAAQRGVRVRILSEGAPPGGIDDLQRWCMKLIAEAGGEIYYMAPGEDAPKGAVMRYRFNHAKYGVIDAQRAIIGTENFSRNSLPSVADATTGGRRGFYTVTDAPSVVQTLRTIFEHDLQPDLFYDLHPFDPQHERYGGPPADFVLPEPTDWRVREAPFGDVVTAAGMARFAILRAPEQPLAPDFGLLHLLHAAGAGDTVVLGQLYEHKYWGSGTSNPIADPNPRLQAIIGAARRGAQVRILLDRFFDDPQALRSNRATVEYVQAVATAEGLDMEARLGNPTGGGIHAKMALVRLGGERWSAIGSLNGGEVSNKLNREIVLLTDMPAIFERLHEVFLWDWALSQ